MSETDNVLVTLKTMTCSDVPNINGRIYSKEESINNTNMNSHLIPITIGEEVVGYTTNIITDNEIFCKITNPELFNKTIAEGFVPDIRYTGNIDNNIVTNMKLISYDLIKGEK